MTTVLTALMSSSVFNSGERPPWMQRNCLFMMAAKGNAQKDSMHASYTRSEYLCLPVKARNVILTIRIGNSGTYTQV